MLKEFFVLQIGGFYGGDIGDLLFRLEQAGAFSYIIPFLLIFALVFGILTRTQIFKDNKTINAVLALAVGLLALQFHFVPIFFSEIFPRLGIGLAIILSFLILVGLFLPEDNNKYANWLLLILSVVIFVVVLSQSAIWSGLGTGGYWTWFIYDNWANVVFWIVILGIVIAVINSVGPKKKISVPDYPTPVYRGR